MYFKTYNNFFSNYLADLLMGGENMYDKTIFSNDLNLVCLSRNYIRNLQYEANAKQKL